MTMPPMFNLVVLDLITRGKHSLALKRHPFHQTQALSQEQSFNLRLFGALTLEPGSCKLQLSTTINLQIGCESVSEPWEPDAEVIANSHISEVFVHLVRECLEPANHLTFAELSLPVNHHKP